MLSRFPLAADAFEPMSNFVIAKCPGCSKSLKVPPDWVGHIIRCKYCDMTIQVRSQGKPQNGEYKPEKSLPVQPSLPLKNSHLPLPARKNDFSFKGAGDVSNLPRFKKSNGRWTTPVLLLLFLAFLGIGLVFALPQLKKILDGGDSKGGDNNGDPNSIVHKDPIGDKGKQNQGGLPELGKDKTPGGNFHGNFPRRALIISIHNYLYANPTQYGMMVSGARNIPGLVNILRNQFHIPSGQIVHLSDNAKENPISPVKSAIESTVTGFLKSSRKQDRVLLAFIGHAVESEGEVFLAPIEGDLTENATLIPLKWLFKELGDSPARQKVLILDVCRFNPVVGSERPGGTPMSEKMEKAIQAAPDGVQVISACSMDQRSMETDNEPMGLFLDSFYAVAQKGIPGKIQQPNDPFPLKELTDSVNKTMREAMDGQNIKQVAKLFGQMKSAGEDFNDSEQKPPKASITGVTPMNPESREMIEVVFKEISTPPVKPSNIDLTLRYEVLPPLSPDAFKQLGAKSGAETELQKAVKRARNELWAVSPMEPPADIKAEVMKIKAQVKVNLNVMRDGYRAPNNENAFKAEIERDEKEVARMFLNLQEALDDLIKLEEAREMEGKRWQANYDFIRARLSAQIAYLYEYQSMLGQLRKELPPRDAKIHGGWKLASTAKLTGDSTGKKLAKESNKTMEQLVKDLAGSPWEILAKREKFTNLGLEWQPTR